MGGYSAYAEYKDSGVEWLGEIPVGWDVKRLRFSLLINPSKSEIVLPDDALVSFVPMEAVGEYGGINLDMQKSLSEIGSGYTYFSDNDVILAKITPCFENGKGAIAKGLSSQIAFGTTELHVLRAGKALNVDFLFYLTISSWFRKLGEAEMYGAGGQKRVPEDFIKDFRVGLPSLIEQQTIARFLDHKTAQIDALIAKKEALLTKLAEKRTALISHAVTKGLDPTVPMKDSGIEWLGEIPAHWGTCYMKRVAKVSYGVGGEIDRGLIEGTNLLSLPNVTKDGTLLIDEVPLCELTEEEKKDALLQKGDLLFNWRNGSSQHLGKTAYFDLDGEWAHVSFLLKLRFDLNISDSHYFQYMLTGLRITGFFISSKAGVNNTFNLNELMNLWIINPPKEEQQAISNYLDIQALKIDNMTLKLKTAIDKLKEYRTALISAAVTGQIDVREAGT